MKIMKTMKTMKIMKTIKKKKNFLMIIIIAASIICISLLVVTYTTSSVKGEYKAGNYFGFDEDTGATATVYVGSSGKLESITIDKFQTKNCYIDTAEDGTKVPYCTATSKIMLGLDDVTTEGKLPWYKQAELFADEVITEQNLEWVELRYMNVVGELVETKPEGQLEEEKVYTDSIADVLIPVDDIYKAIENALEQAKK